MGDDGRDKLAAGLAVLAVLVIFAVVVLGLIAAAWWLVQSLYALGTI